MILHIRIKSFSSSTTYINAANGTYQVSASHNGRGLWLCGFLTASTGPQRRCTPCRAAFSAFSAAHFLASCLFHTDSVPSGSSRRRDEKPRPLHVHRHRDELKVAVVAIQAEIANLRHPIPVLHRRVRTLDSPGQGRCPYGAGKSRGRSGRRAHLANHAIASRTPHSRAGSPQTLESQAPSWCFSSTHTLHHDPKRRGVELLRVRESHDLGLPRDGFKAIGRGVPCTPSEDEILRRHLDPLPLVLRQRKCHQHLGYHGALRQSLYWCLRTWSAR